MSTQKLKFVTAFSGNLTSHFTLSIKYLLINIEAKLG